MSAPELVHEPDLSNEPELANDEPDLANEPEDLAAMSWSLPMSRSLKMIASSGAHWQAPAHW